MRRKLVKIIFWLLRKDDKNMYYDIGHYLTDMINRIAIDREKKLANNEYNKIQIEKNMMMKL